MGLTSRVCVKSSRVRSVVDSACRPVPVSKLGFERVSSVLRLQNQMGNHYERDISVRLSGRNGNTCYPLTLDLNAG